MTGSTLNGFPYPTGSDLIRDGDNAMQALAESVDERHAYRCRAIRSAVLNVNSGAWTLVNSGWAVDYSPPGNKLTITAAGVVIPTGGAGDYLISGLAYWAGAGGTSRRGVAPTVNGNMTPGMWNQGLITAGVPGATAVSTPSVVMQLAAGDTLNLLVFQETGALLGLSSASLSLNRIT